MHQTIYKISTQSLEVGQWNTMQCVLETFIHGNHIQCFNMGVVFDIVPIKVPQLYRYFAYYIFHLYIHIYYKVHYFIYILELYM